MCPAMSTVTPTSTPEPSAAPTSGWRYWGSLPVMLTSMVMITLDFFIVNVTVPSVQRDLNADAAAIQMIVAGYGLAYAAGLITGGRLGDIYGRRKLFMIGIGLFTVASLVCGIAPSPEVLIAARIVQGIAAALSTPQELAILGLVYRGADRSRAFMAAALATAVAGVFGQLIGGLLIAADPDGIGWRLCFLINLPIGIAALVLAPRVVPESRAVPAARLDPLGIVLVTLGMLGIIYPLIEGRERGWPMWTIVCLAAAVPLLVLFVAHQVRNRRRGGSPLVDLSLFRDRPFSLGVVMALLYNSGMASFFLFFALYLQQGRGMTALGSGVLIIMVGVGFVAASVFGPQLSNRIGPRVITLGALVLAAGWLLLLGTVDRFGDSSVWVQAPALVIIGLGMGTVVAPLTSTALATLPSSHAGAASGVLSTSIQLGNALGVAVIGIVFYNTLGSGASAVAYSDALRLSTVCLLALILAVATLAWWLPRNAGTTSATEGNA
ncbi:drug resistance transporter, EmrB/QacA subfamily [Micromonospora siamensis]|uniref:Drug resistance transporter, EmrB/QacA subfamily n=2 Tax=Micromonospora siamensis TaxID=299152 RepID=A0A1C5J6E5_9ACTN|nr:drug resistance transporter, EmrB/QacA subfamily [Micromonospora siamensis]